MRLKFNLSTFMMLIILLTSCSSDNKQLLQVVNAIPSPPYNQFDEATKNVMKAAYENIALSVDKGSHSHITLSSIVAKLAKLYFVNQLNQESIETFKLALSLQPNQFSWHYISGIAAQRLGNFDLAIEQLLMASNLKPRHIPSLLHLAEIYKLSNKRVQTLNNINHILKIEANNPFALFMEAEMLIDDEQPLKAIKILEKLIREHPKANKIYYLIATAQRMQNKPELASKTLLKAGNQSLIYQDSTLENLQKLTTGAGSHLVLANRARKNTNLAVAQTHLLSALEYEPNNITALHNLGFIAGVQGNHTIAIDYLEKALSLESNNTDIASDYATALVAVKRYNEASKIYQQILIINPNDESAKSRLSQLNQFITSQRTKKQL